MTAMQLSRIAFYGRTLDEYRWMFGLDTARFASLRVLDVAAGAASFTAEAAALGARAVAVDSRYGASADTLARDGQNDIEHVLDSVTGNREMFDWGVYGGMEGLRRARETSLRRFTDSYRHPLRERYIAATAVQLPFAGQSFDVALCGHLLFVYDDRLDEDFHVAALAELARVARETRVYPLTALDGEPSRLVAPVMEKLAQRGVYGELVPGGARFVKRASHLLILRRG
ncbi:MAG: SAM-dependent methyltransferase [Nitrospinae bacterium]|nr:SAM-dependent methyltransferase [Nitrospinota bacterium]